MKVLQAGRLKIRIYGNRASLGTDAAALLGERMRVLLEEKAEVNIVFAAAPSQNEFLSALKESAINWGRINAFHMDEYVGLDKDAPQGFANFLKDRLFNHVPLRAAYYLNGNAIDLQQECRRYAQLLYSHPTDIVCAGIGENTHLAFNDPYIADLNDPEMVKLVALDEKSRVQQVNDGCFSGIEKVPLQALTLTIPALLRAPYIQAVVPGKSKADAVYHTVYSEPGEAYPSTVLRNHQNAVLFADEESAAMIRQI